MTADDIARIEQTLAVKLPEQYKLLLIEFPFNKGSFGYSCMVFRDTDALIRLNQEPTLHYRLHYRPGRFIPSKHHFLIGSDGGETQYYLDLESTPAQVLQYELETGELTQFAADIDKYVGRIRTIDKEIDENKRIAAEIRRNAKWWEFWKYM